VKGRLFGEQFSFVVRFLLSGIGDFDCPPLAIERDDIGLFKDIGLLVLNGRLTRSGVTSITSVVVSLRERGFGDILDCSCLLACLPTLATNCWNV